MKLQLSSLDDLNKVASEILQFLHSKQHKFVILRGEMGAGKTTLINELLHVMGIQDHSSSPTYSIVNEYFSVNYGVIYHFDFYRIENDEEAYDIGVEEIFEEDAYVFIEWPERIENLLPSKYVCLTITIEDEIRTIEVEEV
jgi:tRNA threonylcarbamoyladenosine biosynthesis protein TsaE